MQLFSRTITLRGNPRDVGPYVRDIHELVDELSSFDISLWRGLLGMPVGSFAFSCVVDSRAALLAGMAEIEENPDYLDLVDKGQDFFVAPAEDRLVDVIHTSGGEFRRADIGAAVTITTAQTEVARTAEALGWATGMADLAAQITTFPVNVGASQHGHFGELNWIATYPDMVEVDRAYEAMAKDEDYLHRLADAEGLFVPGSGQQMLGMRIG